MVIQHDHLYNDSKKYFDEPIGSFGKQIHKNRKNVLSRLHYLTMCFVAEREAGITIDVSLRYYSLPNENSSSWWRRASQYTATMITRSIKCRSLIIVLIDARLGSRWNKPGVFIIAFFVAWRYLM